MKPTNLSKKTTLVLLVCVDISEEKKNMAKKCKPPRRNASVDDILTYNIH